MKPHVICHMVSSIDGRILHSRWRPSAKNASELYETIHEKLGGDAWLVGRTTGQEFSKREEPYAATAEALPREAHIVSRDAPAYGIVIDAQGKIRWGRAAIGGDPIVVVLTKEVGDAHLAGLRGEGVSYLFGGESEIDLAATLEALNRELGIETLLLEGGGGINGAFLRAGLVDEVSVVVCPAIDGAKGAPALFDSGEAIDGASAPLGAVVLESHEVLDGGAVWLRYRLENDRAPA